MKIFFTRLKIILLRKEAIFWMLVFPLLLASVEYLAFSDYINTVEVETINIGLTLDDTKIDDTLKSVMSEANISEDNKLFNILEYSNTTEAEEALTNKDISVYLYLNEGKTAIKSNNSINATITYSVINQARLIEDTITEAYTKYYQDVAQGLNPEPVDTNEIIRVLTSEGNYFSDISNNKNGSVMLIYFYTLIAMGCLYCCFMGLSMMNDLRADRSALGIRISTSVVSKPKLVGVYFLACLLLEVISSVLIYLYYTYVLHIALGNGGLVILSIIIGGITGLSFGILVGALVGGSDIIRQTVLSNSTLVFCILSGMVSVGIKDFINQNMAWVNYINPAALITDSLYSLYYYDNYDSYLIYTSILVGISIVSLIIAFIKTRGEKYASL